MSVSFVRRILAVALLLGTPAWCYAHGLDVQCSLKNGRIVVEAYFDNDEPAADVPVVVRDSAGEPVATGRTNSQGLWSFPQIAPGSYRVIVDAGDGHRVEKPLTITDRDARASGAGRAAFTGYQVPKVIGGLLLLGILVLVVRRFRRLGTAPRFYNEGKGPPGTEQSERQ